ncbi:hypothetical protein [Micromonospora inyonensis]|nr:hypothetical protein [Micromonospora inyonensis]
MAPGRTVGTTGENLAVATSAADLRRTGYVVHVQAAAEAGRARR